MDSPVSATDDLWKLATAYAIILAGIVGVAHFKLAGATEAWHRCLCRGPDWLARPAVELASPGKARKMKHQPCALNGWILSHFLSNVVLGALFPSLWWAIIGAGTAWETFEYFHDEFQPLDIMYNTLGVALGVWLRAAYEA